MKWIRKIFKGRSGGGVMRAGGDEPRVTETRWFGVLMSVCGVMVVAALCIESVRWLNRKGREMVEQRPIPAVFVLKDAPGFLNRTILDPLRGEAEEFANRDKGTRKRVEDVLDSKILEELAAQYVGTVNVNGKAVDRHTVGFNAWIKQITQVTRNVDKGANRQTIEIAAEWRRPFAWVEREGKLYLVDPEGVRLPGEYAMRDRAALKALNLMLIAGVDVPKGADGVAGVPLPSRKWETADMTAAMQLAELLRGQPFAGQIDAINMKNFKGRVSAGEPWIALNTVFMSQEGKPHVVLWGRPIGDEGVREVSARAKLKTMMQIYLRYSRIDANTDYVQINFDFPTIPKLATDAGDVAPARLSRG